MSGVFKIIYGCNNFVDVEYIILEATMWFWILDEMKIYFPYILYAKYLSNS